MPAVNPLATPPGVCRRLTIVGQRMALIAALQASAFIRSRKSPSLPIAHSPCRPPSSHERPAHHKQQPGAERACRSSAQRPAVAAGGRPFRRRCFPATSILALVLPRSDRYGQKRPLRAFWLRTSPGSQAPTGPRRPSEAHRQNPAPEGTDKNALPGPSGSVPFRAVRPQPAPESPLRPIGKIRPRKVRTKSPSQGLLAPYLFGLSGPNRPQTAL